MGLLYGIPEGKCSRSQTRTVNPHGHPERQYEPMCRQDMEGSEEERRTWQGGPARELLWG